RPRGVPGSGRVVAGRPATGRLPPPRDASPPPLVSCAAPTSPGTSAFSLYSGSIGLWYDRFMTKTLAIRVAPLRYSTERFRQPCHERAIQQPASARCLGLTVRGVAGR